MKKQHIGNGCRQLGRIASSFVLSALLLLTACDEDKSKPEKPNEGALLQEIVPVLAPVSGEFEGIEKYGVSLYLFNDLSSECYKYQAADNFAGVHSFIVERAAYELVALMTNPESNNIRYEGSLNATRGSVIKVVDSNKSIPDMVVGRASIQQKVEGNVELSDYKRLVGRLNVSMTDVPSDVTDIEMTINSLYDQVSFDGEYGFSNGQGATKTLKLSKTETRSGATYSTGVVMLPTDASQETMRVDFRVFKGDEVENYIVRVEGGILANQIAQINGMSEEILKNATLATGLTYAPWDNSTSIEDDLTIKDDLNKVWSSSSLPISGSAAPGYDNFWASSSLVNDWAKLYDSHLYDGIKDLDNKDLYWGPDVESETANGTTPSWYIDLGAEREGITINYWNKFGGAGGQKIRTMAIYGSNTKSDYEGGNDNWTLISTFTSDKTLPTVDAGAEVTTGRVEFNEGKTSYRYIKCAMTSRVNNLGEIVEDSDVNVAEVEISVWSCK